MWIFLLTNEHSLHRITKHIQSICRSDEPDCFFSEASDREKRPSAERRFSGFEKGLKPGELEWKGSVFKSSLPEYIHGALLRKRGREGHFSVCPIRVVPRVQARPFVGTSLFAIVN